MKKLGGIYVIEVDDVGRYYGESSDIHKRWARHRLQLNRNTHPNAKLRVAWKELGAQKFHFWILEESLLLSKSKQARLLRENFYIVADELSLNVVGNLSGQGITLTTIPNRPIYRNRTLLLKRQGRKSLIHVYDAKTKERIGVETVAEKMRLGTFVADKDCNIVRAH